MRRSILGAVVLFASAISIPALAQNRYGAHPYVGIAGGASHLNGDCSPGLNCDNDDAAYKIYGGVSFPGDFGAELTYYDLGKFAASAPGIGGSASLKGSYWGFGGAWRPQFGSGWGAALRVGAAYGEGKIDVSGVGSQSRQDWHPYGGVGITYAVTPNIRIEADWDWTRVGSQWRDPVTGTTAQATDNVQSYMIGASFEF